MDPRESADHRLKTIGLACFTGKMKWECISEFPVIQSWCGNLWYSLIIGAHKEEKNKQNFSCLTNSREWLGGKLGNIVTCWLDGRCDCWFPGTRHVSRDNKYSRKITQLVAQECFTLFTYSVGNSWDVHFVSAASKNLPFWLVCWSQILSYDKQKGCLRIRSLDQNPLLILVVSSFETIGIYCDFFFLIKRLIEK